MALAGGEALAQRQARLVPARWHQVLTICLVNLFVVDWRTVGPFTVQTYPDQSVYRRIAADPGDFTVFEVPVGVRSGTDVFGRRDILQFYQTIHHKRMINGMVARMPRSVFDYYLSSPALQFLAGQLRPVNHSYTEILAREIRPLK